MAATKDANVVVVGENSRVTVSADGMTAESTDELFKSLLILDKNPSEGGGEHAAFSVSHIVSPTPVETHVFLSFMHRKPFYVGTGKESVWKVEDGSISIEKMDSGRPRNRRSDHA